VLFLLIGRPQGAAPPATVESLEEGVATLSTLVEWEQSGKAKFAGVFSGSNGLAFALDVESLSELHLSVAALPPFPALDWQVIPLLSAEEDLAIAQAALDRYRDAAGGG
jgi:hypothetical protein